MLVRCFGRVVRYSEAIHRAGVVAIRRNEEPAWHTGRDGHGSGFTGRGPPSTLLFESANSKAGDESVARMPAASGRIQRACFHRQWLARWPTQLPAFPSSKQHATGGDTAYN